MARFVSVAVPVPQLDVLTYRVPEELEAPAAGARVLVPVGSRLLTGCVTATWPPESAPPDDHAPVRDVVDVLDEGPFLPEACLRLALWTAQYYACAPGEAVAAALPPLSTMESRRVAEITPAGLETLDREGLDGLDGMTRAALRVVGDARRIFVSSMGTRLTAALQRHEPVPIHAVLARLARFGLITVSRVVAGDRSAARSEGVCALTPQGRALADDTLSAAGLGPRQRQLLAALREAPDGLTGADLRSRGLPTDGLRRLAVRGLVVTTRRTVERDPFAGPWSVDAHAAQQGPRTLTDEQQRALALLSGHLARGGFRVALVHGVTGSGKTEVYLRLAAQAVLAGRQVLVLVPEIGLTPVLAGAFRQTFGDRVAVQHSGLSDGERHDQWQRIRRGDVSVVVGTRSAVFAPLEDVGLVVVDEEHDSSYKQDEAPRYHGRDLAIVRAKHAGALVVLGSATPSLESYQHAQAGRYVLVELDQRVWARPLADVRTVNMRDVYAEHGPDTIVSEPLMAAIGERMTRREQVLLLLNRRGFSTAVFCRQCGGSVECPNCSVSLVVYGRGTAACHYCNYARRVPRTCPTCGAPYLELTGFGTERVEREVADAFPDARVARIDRDAVRRRGALPAILAEFGRGRIDVLVGTQMIAKGHDFPRVTLVGVISADVGLGLADFRAAERTFQLLTQVVGRAGRGERPGEAIIQTIYPDHYSIRHACRQDYRAFFQDEIRFRQAMHYPPTVALINAVVRGTSLEAAMEGAADLVRRIGQHAPAGIQVMGPAMAPLARLRGDHRAQFFVKGRPTSRAMMREAVRTAMRERPDLQRRVVVDIDPMNIL